MYEPERPLEPREPEIVTGCRRCGEVIYEGDIYYRMPIDVSARWQADTEDLCESCAFATLAAYRRTARKEDA